MEAENVNEFLESITWQEDIILFKGKKYFFNPCGYPDRAVLDIQRLNLKNEWEEDFYHVEGATTRECVTKMTAAPIWDGKTFWEAEPAMTWTEW